MTTTQIMAVRTALIMKKIQGNKSCILWIKERSKIGDNMTREERVKRYMEILDENEKENSSRNWNILDKLTDAELFDENKIAECMDIIDKYDMRLKNNPNKYPEEIMMYVRQRLGIDAYDDSRDAEINKMSANEVFEHVCNWNGLLGYADTIKSWVTGVYKVEF